MKNYEKYAEEIKNFRGSNFCTDFIKPHIINSPSCNGANCAACRMLQMIWLLEEYEEPETDWSKVEIDTPILVRDSEEQEWYKRYFAKYENGKVYAWPNGCTSWTVYDSNDMIEWVFAKLAENEDK